MLRIIPATAGLGGFLVLRTLTAKLAGLLALYGGCGLFAISFLDSSVLSFPFVNDLLLIHLASRFPLRAPIYALDCVAGSVLGACLVYGMARAGTSALRREGSPNRLQKVGQWLERNGFVAILVASLLPPPVPFKLFSIGAGALRMNFARFSASLLFGRSLRFVVAAWMGVRYGALAEVYLKRNAGPILLLVAVLILAGAFAYRRLYRTT